MSWPLLVLFIGLQVPLGDDPAYSEGMRLYEDFEYERAVFRFKEALRFKDRSNSDQAVIGLRLGMTYAELRDDQGALDAFEAALTEDPLLVLPPDASPKIKDMLDKARQAVREKRSAGKIPLPVATAPTKGPASSKPAAQLENLPPAEKPSVVQAGAVPQAPPAAPESTRASGVSPAPAAAQPQSSAPVADVPVVEESEGGGLPWLMISGAGVGVVGAVALVGGATGLGVAAYFLSKATDPAVFNDDHVEYVGYYNISLVTGLVLGAASLVTVLTGAALASSSILTGEFDDGGETLETAPLPIEEVPTLEAGSTPVPQGAGQ